ncbi:flagellar biosynthetic protein FliQ [Acetobacteraceae bacterium KSS8]|uniref:Flagellar biosynthetic protein FliQ n=1 Tax=Endosaccharibacter trunci TaxID=2812733 RepID=A0ABT1W9U7_9PROT|nr:flagellar biosynthetic protein FliQ [Acetobacteraceae bacterium KSS8]
MAADDVGMILRVLFLVVLKLSAPGLLAALVVGVVISLIQAVTQINESTLAFVPKLLVVGVALSVAGPFMFTTLFDFTHLLFDRLIETGGE